MAQRYTLIVPVRLLLFLALLGSTVPAIDAQPRFTDQTAAAGIQLRNTFGGQDKQYILEAHGSGAAFFDHDGDGDLDLYIVNGATLETYQMQSGTGNALYKNQGDGTFADITDQAGVGHAGWGAGVAVGDSDGDGRRDLYVTNYGANVLYRAGGDDSYADIAQQAGVDGDSYSASAAFFDYDRDGDLDLYVANYVVFDATNPPAGQDCVFFGGLRVYCGPKGMPGAPDRLYMNRGDGTFADVTEPSGVAQANRYYGLGVVPTDFDSDGLLDLYVANDETPNVLFHNQGNGTFKDIALVAGAAYNGDGEEEAGMGVDAGDFDNDGDPDLYVTNFFSETNTLYRNEQSQRFTDITAFAGLGTATLNLLGWGTGFFDYDNDGLLDLFIANGHVYPQVDLLPTGSPYRQPNQLFRNQGNGRFTPVQAGPGLTVEKVSRGAAFSDYDDDGDVDIFVVDLGDIPTLLRNEGGNQRHWLKVQVVGKGADLDAVGTRIHLRAAGHEQWRTINGSSSYLSYNDIRAHFGLGDQLEVEEVEITWPDGSNYTVTAIPADRLLLVRQGRDHAILELGAPVGD
ncbi:MAG: hypothetical protein GKR89_16495 [Candidatus Latescibacteria bacterium]|nr:hypothetical protein [Candidatus Latescibacterota bacterium]